LVSRAGLEPERPIDESQVIDCTNRQKRQNRYLSQTEVHSGYTEPVEIAAGKPRILPANITAPGVTRAALYLRISTKTDKRDDDAARQRKRQDVENQRRQLREFCEAQGWQIVDEYTDEESGAKSDRAGFQRMWQDAAQRRFDVLLFWALDRFSREGVIETLNYLQRLHSFGINWRSHTEQYLDSCGVFREAVLAILAAIAKQERIRISERTRAGLDRAREKGTRTGRPIGRPRLVFHRDHVRELRKEGLSWRQIGIRLRASPTAIRRAHAAAVTAENGDSGTCREVGKENGHV
jgi:DNA invertase Pin-like site-specific DNA recombinase